MCHNDYRSSDRIVKQKNVLELDSNTTLLAQLEVISKQLSTYTLPASVSHVQTLRCDFCEEWHANGKCVPEGASAKVQNAKF